MLNDEAAGGVQAFGPFGERLGFKLPIHALADPAQYGFTGRSLDPESGVYFYRARMLDPRTGRFLTQDPIGFGGGDANLYRYGYNSPGRLVDPSGRNATLYWVPAIHFTVAIDIPGNPGQKLVVELNPYPRSESEAIATLLGKDVQGRVSITHATPKGIPLRSISQPSSEDLAMIQKAYRLGDAFSKNELWYNILNSPQGTQCLGFAIDLMHGP